MAYATPEMMPMISENLKPIRAVTIAITAPVMALTMT
jgi:hypothetical protein